MIEHNVTTLGDSYPMSQAQLTAVGNFQMSYPHTNLQRLMGELQRSNQRKKQRDLRVNPKGKNNEGERIRYNSRNYNGRRLISSVDFWD